MNGNAPGTDRWKCWLAEGFGTGRIPRAPGTLGSVVGLGWFALLCVPGEAWVFIAATLAGLAIAVWLCGEAERILARRDPSSVVLDEIAALPLCFAGLLADHCRLHGFPTLPGFLSAHPWWTLPAGFVAFRFFDIVKPWPVKQSQRLPGGWGVVVDDVLAAGWVNGVFLLMQLWLWREP